MRKITTICAVLCLLISACNFKKAPKCDEERVKNTAIELIKEKIKEQLTKGDRHNPFDVSDLETSIYSETIKIVGAKFPESVYNEKSMGLCYHYSYKETDEFKQFKKQTEDSLENVAINDLNINIKSIRLVNTNNEIKKCDCEADVYSEDTRINSITYSAQYTEDETIYVTVSFE